MNIEDSTRNSSVKYSYLILILIMIGTFIILFGIQVLKKKIKVVNFKDPETDTT